MFMKDANLTVQDLGQSTAFWTVNSISKSDPNSKQGLKFYVYSDTYSTLTFGFSLITIYTSVILVIGKLIRDIFSGDIQIIFLNEQPKPENLL